LPQSRQPGTGTLWQRSGWHSRRLALRSDPGITPWAQFHPHCHESPRYIYVLQGPWWVSFSTIHDFRLTYPVPAGSFVEDLSHGIHWDENRVDAGYTTRLYITGVTPATNHNVDVYGNEVPPQGARRL
jgi:hypothetical protein